MAETRALKILVVGGDGSGKGLLLRRLGQPFPKSPLFGVRLFKIDIEGIPIMLNEWIGPDNPHLLPSSFFEGAVGACVVYDVRNASSFYQAKTWLQVLRDDFDVEKIMLVANFAHDVKYRVVSTQDGKALAEESKCNYREVDPFNISEFQDGLYTFASAISMLYFT